MTKAQLIDHKIKITSELHRMEREYGRIHTNHILHLLLSVVTGGIWVICWIFIASSNKTKRAKLEDSIDESKLTLMQISEELIPAVT